MNLTPSFRSQLKQKTSLAQYSTYEIGGEARFLAEPKTTEQLVSLLKEAREQKLKIFIFGGGSNILFPDFPDPNTLFISTRNCFEANFHRNKLFVSAGVPLSTLAVIGMMNDLADFNFTFLLPGTFGGGIYMNAKYFNAQISDVLDKVYYLDLTNIQKGICSLPAEKCAFAYKTSCFQTKNWLITGADLKLSRTLTEFSLKNVKLKEFLLRQSFPNTLKNFADYYLAFLDQFKQQGKNVKEMEKVVQDRLGKKHFAYPSCGSVFKNNYAYGVPTGQLVDQLNLCGTKQGGAMISPTHGNLILNYAHAQASDVIGLIQLVQNEISKAFGFVPELEVIFGDAKY